MIGQAHKPKAELRPIRPSDIPEVVDIHFRNLSPNTDRRFHERALYPTICHPASTGFGFVQVRDGKVVGFIVGMLDTSAGDGLSHVRGPSNVCLPPPGSV